MLTVPAALCALPSCTADTDPAPDMAGSEATVRIKAGISQTEDTRAYQEQGDIITGRFYMTYPTYADPYVYNVCKVNFFEGTGVTTTNNNLELKWQDVGALTYNDELTVFWLDNVPQPEDNPNATEIIFTDSYNPFVAAEFDDDGGTNDLLWGYQNPRIDGTQEIRIGVHHMMSRVSVIVTVDNSNENAEKIDFSKGTVTLTNVIHKGESYNRTNGTISLGSDPEYSDLRLALGEDWASITPDETEEGITYYQTRNFVLPPQSLRTDDSRPRLVINVPQSNGSFKRYSGVLPRIMTVNGAPATMAFEPEKNLTLKVKISQDLLYIESIYAFVQDWVDKGTHTVIASQAGIYSYDQFISMIEAYNRNDNSELIHYGYMVDGVWTFDIFTDLTVDEDVVKGLMKSDGPDFKFDLAYRSLTINMEDGSVKTYYPGDEESGQPDQTKDAAEALKNLLLGN